MRQSPGFISRRRTVLRNVSSALAIVLTLLLGPVRASAEPRASSTTLSGFAWEGVTQLPQDELEQALTLRPRDRLDDRAAAGAVQSAAAHYRNRGFLDIAISSRPVEAPGGTLLTLSVSEGPRYTLGTVSFRNLRRVSPAL
ncbi:MAG: hypothetical protein COV48_14605, partial [Elusimicrobia bacterium CG11_big_fil_rev_8_21_14_0_20_64_6]